MSAARHAAGPTLVLDWDGTVVEEDILVMALERFGDLTVLDRADSGLDGEPRPWAEVMAASVATLRAPLEDVSAWILGHVRIRPGLHELVARYESMILSGNLGELIHPVLAREGLDLRVVANGVEPHPGGWRLRLNDALPCDGCRPAGDPCKRSSLPAGQVVYVGDSISDYCAARAAPRVFARDGLARHLAERGLPFEPFDDLHDVLAALERGA